MKIKDFIDYEQPTDYIVESDRYSDEYRTPVLTAGQSFILGYTNEKEGIYNKCPCIIFDDFTTSVHYVDFPFKVKSSAMKILTSKHNTNLKYCYYLLLSLSKMPPNHKRQWISTTSEKKHFLPSIDNQVSIVKQLDLVSDIISHYTMQINYLDNLIKARFVELFGDPLTNPLKLKTKIMTEVCEIIDGDRGKNYPVADDFKKEDYCLFLNAKNVTCEGFNFDTCMFISKEKDKQLRKGKLTRGDIVLTTRGTLGNLAFYTDDVPFENVRINSGMVILRMKRDIVNEVYFIEQFKMLLVDIKEKIASGSAQPQLPISTMNKIDIMIPDIERQRQFASFVTQVDKSKLAVQKSLEKTQQLFDSLMQEYFG